MKVTFYGRIIAAAIAICHLKTIAGEQGKCWVKGKKVTLISCPVN
ncbi:hypothetical protein [Nostoc sp. 'Peltigera membranacea cyanobiont' 232]|nr:hypothetical protein [Nostoc sp. 'Peltigera membranacea cyanobiont' 232]